MKYCEWCHSDQEHLWQCEDSGDPCGAAWAEAGHPDPDVWRAAWLAAEAHLTNSSSSEHHPTPIWMSFLAKRDAEIAAFTDASRRACAPYLTPSTENPQ